jgi:hypothetical protein
MKKLCSLFLVLAAVFFDQSAHGQAQQYTLLAESTFTDDCLICGRPSLVVPMRGTFTLAVDEVTPLSTVYRMENIEWTGGHGTNVQYIISGSGTYTVGGEVAVTKKMVLNLTVNAKNVVFTNDGLPSLRGFPDYVIDTSLTQTQQDLITFYSMDLLATALREVWLSTPQEVSGGGGTIGPGDLVSGNGGLVKSNRDLVRRLGLMPVVPHLAVDAVEIAPGGEVWFSLNDRGFSESLGEINDGDIVSAEGRIVRKYYTLIGAFYRPPLPTFPPDSGLDAFHVSDSGKLLFSVRSNFFSTALAKTVSRGDLLTDRGQIFRSNAELLQRFQPVTAGDVGLDAVHVWPSGEIWFSTDASFTDAERGLIQHGDILSDAGYIAFRNQDLLRQYRGGLNEPDFGLDALFVVSDLSMAAPPRMTSIARGVHLTWEGLGRVFQLERATRVTGPYMAITPIIPDNEWLDALTGNLPATGFYRVRQW